MCCLQLDLIFIFKMAATRTVQKVKIRHISVTSHHMKTNNGSTPRFLGTGNALMALFLYFQVKVTSWVNVIGHVRHQKVKICHISVTSCDIKPNKGSPPTFSGTGKPLVSLFLCFKVKVTPWVNVIGHMSATRNLIYVISQYLVII